MWFRVEWRGPNGSRYLRGTYLGVPLYMGTSGPTYYAYIYVYIYIYMHFSECSGSLEWFCVRSGFSAFKERIRTWTQLPSIMA